MILDERQFQVWRAVVAMTHTDGRVQAAEKDWVLGCLDQLGAEGPQKDQLIRELEQPQALAAILAGLSEPKDLAHVVHLANLLFRADQKLDANEAKIYAQLMQTSMNRVNMGELLATIAKIRAEAVPVKRRFTKWL